MLNAVDSESYALKRESLQLALQSASAFAWRQLACQTRECLELLLAPNAIEASKDYLRQRLTWIVERHSMPLRELETISRSAVQQEPCLNNKIQTEDCRLFARFPTLQSLFRRLIAGWAAYITDFGRHALRFAEQQNWNCTRSFIEHITFGLSDPHNGGRTVVRAELHDSTVWFYKPRSGQQENAWAEIVKVINTAGFSPNLMAVSVSSRDDHCWMPEVAHNPWQDQQQAQLLYIRIGALLYLGHLLRAVDLHANNLIVHGEYPVLIDCETLLHPNVPLPASAFDQPDSILRTGIVHPSGKGIARDRASFLRQVIMRKQNVPRERIADFLTLGFEAMHSFLNLGKAFGLDDAIANLAALPVRVIYRPTRYYVEILDKSMRGGLAKSEEARRWFLHTQLDNDHLGSTIINQEVKQLIHCDVPLFMDRAAMPRSFPSSLEKREILQIICDSCKI